MGKTLDEKSIIQAIEAFVFNYRINDYALERVAFGFDKFGGIAPIDLYLEHLRLDINDHGHKRSNVVGMYIDRQEHIRTEQTYAQYMEDFFVDKLTPIFFDAPKECLDADQVGIKLIPRCRNYLLGLLPLFIEVLNTEVKYDAFDVIPTDQAARATEYPKWKKFVTEILLKPIVFGSKINSYVKDFKNAPYYVRQLIKKKGRNFYLKDLDDNIYDYAFALFSLMLFINNEHGKLLELKMLEWERRHKFEFA